jgi:putative SOS response-associated peptidase YedK
MCTLYRLSRMYAEVARTFRATVGTLPNAPIPDVYPDRTAPVVRQRDGGREVITMRWGFPPLHFLAFDK